MQIARYVDSLLALTKEEFRKCKYDANDLRHKQLSEKKVNLQEEQEK